MQQQADAYLRRQTNTHSRHRTDTQPRVTKATVREPRALLPARTKETHETGGAPQCAS